MIILKFVFVLQKEMDDYCEVFEFLRNGNASDESIQTIGEEKVHYHYYMYIHISIHNTTL